MRVTVEADWRDVGEISLDVSISTDAIVTIDRATRPLDLALKRSRLPVENATLHALPAAEPIENRPGVGEGE